MAEKKEKKGGGCFTQILLGLLAGIALFLAVVFFLSAGPVDQEDDSSLADSAAAGAPAAEPVTPLAPAPKVETRPVAPPQHDAGLDPSSDDQIAEDAAAAGMTSRTPSPQPE